MQLVTTALAAIALITLAGPAAAYLGPGAGLGAIGAVIALLAAVALAVVGFVWYPFKRLVAAGRSRRRADDRDSTER
ncbi:MAG: hypothetical protein ACLFTG_05470 [Alphaproteobacteria bacterium]